MARWWRGGGGFLQAADPPAFRRNSTSGYHRTIQAVPRELAGCRFAAKERAAGRIPSVVLTRGQSGAGASNKQLLTTDAKQIRELLKQSPFFCSTPIRLQVRAGPGSAVVLQSGTVLPIKVKRNAETGQIMNLVMAWAEKGSDLKVDVPVVFKGEDICPGLKKGGYLQKIRTSLKYLCPPEHIPQKVEVDLTKLDIGDSILTHNVEVHPSVKLWSKDDTTPICKILEKEPDESEPKTEVADVHEVPVENLNK
ncbi:hypothetical protein Cni_G16554 [Canna indica]|uniref:Large ribosomal subunit protein bL25 beta domain-containing protein n=1 Tax=Canna indica TaxID=4628 RepID=A0AAQ3KHX3_9LILI|nr:hypothetical protein Cni_G16554 [Canna indica]